MWYISAEHHALVDSTRKSATLSTAKLEQCAVKINLPYAPGYTFWSPRVWSRNERVTITHEGHEYSRYDDTLEILARHKRITRVEVAVSESGEISCQYWGTTVGSLTEWPSLVDPENGFDTEDAALAFARHWRDTEKTEYFGQGCPEEPYEADAYGDDAPI